MLTLGEIAARAGRVRHDGAQCDAPGGARRGSSPSRSAGATSDRTSPMWCGSSRANGSVGSSAAGKIRAPAEETPTLPLPRGEGAKKWSPRTKLLSEVYAETAFHAVNMLLASPKSRKERLSGLAEGRGCAAHWLSDEVGRRSSFEISNGAQRLELFDAEHESCARFGCATAREPLPRIQYGWTWWILACAASLRSTSTKSRRRKSCGVSVADIVITKRRRPLRDAVDRGFGAPAKVRRFAAGEATARRRREIAVPLLAVMNEILEEPGARRAEETRAGITRRA